MGLTQVCFNFFTELQTIVNNCMGRDEEAGGWGGGGGVASHSSVPTQLRVLLEVRGGL